MKIGIIVIHYGQVDTTNSCLSSLQGKVGDSEIIIVDNGGGGGQAKFKNIKVIGNGNNVGYAAAVNQGINYFLKNHTIQGFLILNNDLVWQSSKLERLSKTFLDKKTAGIVSPLLNHSGDLYDWGGKLNRYTGLVTHLNFHERPKTIMAPSHVAGAAMLITRDVIEQVGMFDPRFFMYYEDVDYCLRVAQAGYTIHVNPEVVLEHSLSASSRPSRRIIYIWKSHIIFTLKHLFKYIWPSAFIVDFVYYPILFVWATLKSIL